MKITISVDDRVVMEAVGGASIGYWTAHRELWSTKCKLWVRIQADCVGAHGGADRAEYEVGAEQFADGLALMAVNYGERFARVVSRQADAEDGDILIQLSLFGKLLFG